MRGYLLTLPVALAGALLLTGCGSQQAGSQSGGRPPASGARPGEVSCGAQPSDAQSATGTRALPGDSSGPAKDGVRITASSGACAEFEVTNSEPEPFTYSVTFEFRSGSGEALATAKQTVASVGPGRTVKSSVNGGPLPNAGGKPQVRIAEVRSVPSSEASAEAGPCPQSGVRVYADDADAAMGLRALSLHLENCGTATSRLNGYPQLQLLDERHAAVDTVKILQGGSTIATGTGADGTPEPLVLKPGERAYAVLVWRNTVEAGAGSPVDAPYLRVRAKPGSDPVMVIPELDLGTTGQLGVGPWKKDETQGRPATGATTGTQPPAQRR
ncbi:DUF4232 domain-containing protein [Kitasatospora sp. MAP5-34]|uniref:DUF4232 domain-containing protein n=1 Tax=Kitasatospora sp. MAP5-34 TaxID=3035102 RepID=UPI002475ECD3|nr:DUF4232 domain-containing protein [Kitasatospora sp. MAP5-34]MDH6579161.1 hypothetical protein [Kitasatospora sp. MAP5-34]